MAEHDHHDTPPPDEARALVRAILAVLDVELVEAFWPLLWWLSRPGGERSAD